LDMARKGILLIYETFDEMDARRSKRGQPMNKCFSCSKELKMFDAMNLHPSDALHFCTQGHYGSTFFDPMDGSKLNIYICDDCLVSNTDKTIET